jgi:glyoxylate/hydroxypyruvate reductase A
MGPGVKPRDDNVVCFAIAQANAMSLVVRVGTTRADWWRDALQELLPDVDCRLWDDPGDKAAVDYAVVWRPPARGHKNITNQKVKVSKGAGNDHQLVDPELPRHLPVIRTRRPGQTQPKRE